MAGELQEDAEGLCSAGYFETGQAEVARVQGLSTLVRRLLRVESSPRESSRKVVLLMLLSLLRPDAARVLRPIV